MPDDDVDIKTYRDSLEQDLAKWQEDVNSDDPEIAEEAEAQIDNYALEVAVRHRVRVLLTFGGPSVWLDADAESARDGWERIGEITLHHSWGFDRKEIPVADGSALADYFDNQLWRAR